MASKRLSAASRRRSKMKSDSDAGQADEVKMETDGPEADDVMDPITAQFKVVVCHPPADSALYRIQFPTRKTTSLTKDVTARFKKNVKMLEVKRKANTRSASFDGGKAKHLAAICLGSESGAMDDLSEETYQGRSFRSDAPLHYAIGFFKNEILYLWPLEGTLEMKRSISYLNNQGKRTTAMEIDAELTESESEMHSPTRAPIRVRFARPETERQKKRREESALHRSKVIEQDPWISLNIHSEEDLESKEKCVALADVPSSSGLSVDKVDPEQLIQEAIIGQKLKDLDLDNCDQLISLRRIRYLPEVRQVRALMIKVCTISTSEAMQYVSSSIARDLLISRIRDCAHLVCGIWVLKSEMLYKGDGQTTFRAARDLALSLINCGLPVRRSELKDAFGLSSDDVTSILSTFGRPPTARERTWTLRVSADDNFVTNKEELQILVEEKRYWHKRWEEIHKYLQAENERAKKGSRPHRTSSRRISGSASSAKRRTNSGTRVVVID